MNVASYEKKVKVGGAHHERALLIGWLSVSGQNVDLFKNLFVKMMLLSTLYAPFAV